jgi:hypothetical protein
MRPSRFVTGGFCFLVVLTTACASREQPQVTNPSQVSDPELPPKAEALVEETLSRQAAWNERGITTYAYRISSFHEGQEGTVVEPACGSGITAVTVEAGQVLRAVDHELACEVSLSDPDVPVPLTVDDLFELVIENAETADVSYGRGYGFPDYVTWETEPGFFEVYVPFFREGPEDPRLLTAPVVSWEGDLAPGVAHRYLLNVHCGMAWLSFAGNAWHAPDAPPYATGGKPYPPETWPVGDDQDVETLVTLLSEDQIRLEVVGPGEIVEYGPSDEPGPGCA